MTVAWGGGVFVIGGVEYLTTSEVCQRLSPDVGPETVRNWTRPRRVGGALERPLVQPLADRGGRRATWDGELILPWPQVVEAEYATRTSGRGRRRAGDRRVA